MCDTGDRLITDHSRGVITETGERGFAFIEKALLCGQMLRVRRVEDCDILLHHLQVLSMALAGGVSVRRVKCLVRG